MKTLRVQSAHSVSSAELLLEQISELGDATPSTLTIPTRLKNDDIGGVGSCAQAICTWSRQHPDAALRTYVDPANLQADLTRLMRTTHGLVGVLMANTVLDRHGDSIHLPARQAAVQRLHQLDEPNKKRHGHTRLLIAADHTSLSKPHNLYDIGAERLINVRSVNGFSDVVGDILRLSDHEESPRQLNSILTQRVELAKMLRELFLNTHMWARTDENEHRLRPSIRLIRAEWTTGNSAHYLKQATGDPLLAGYIKRERHSDQQRFFDLTVLDSGPGVAARRLATMSLARTDNVAEQYRATRDCLAVHFTSAAGSHHGKGFHRVFEMLTALRAYVRIRSGNLALARDFIDAPYLPKQDISEPWLTDWSTNSDQISKLARAEGTLITVLVPTGNGERRA